MSEPASSLKAAAPVMAKRQDNPTQALTPDERNALQDATLAVVSQFRQGSSQQAIQQQLTENGWLPNIAAGFTGLVSQLLAKMYFQRTWIFAICSVFTSMIASIAVPQANAGEFPWWAAAVSLGISIVCILGTLRNFQLYRQYRQK
jgi:hypothetical protein